VFACVLALDLAGCTHLATSALMEATGADYLPASEFDSSAVLGAPPANNSRQTKAEIALMLDQQRARTAEDCELAQADVKIHPDQFREAVGMPGSLVPEAAPAARRLFRRIRAVEIAAVARAKDSYDRSRPYKVDSRLEPCVTLPRDKSYPSGHSTWAFLTASVLAEMFPERKDAILTRAQSFAQSRVTGGVHFPSDIQAGQIWGETLARKLLGSEEFRNDLTLASQELRKLTEPTPATATGN